MTPPYLPILTDNMAPASLSEVLKAVWKCIEMWRLPTGPTNGG
jgi:hypothetical protein